MCASLVLSGFGLLSVAVVHRARTYYPISNTYMMQPLATVSTCRVVQENMYFIQLELRSGHSWHQQQQQHQFALSIGREIYGNAQSVASLPTTIESRQNEIHSIWFNCQLPIAMHTKSLYILSFVDFFFIALRRLFAASRGRCNRIEICFNSFHSNDFYIKLHFMHS